MSINLVVSKHHFKYYGKGPVDPMESRGPEALPSTCAIAYDLIIDRLAVPDSNDSPAVLIDSAENGGDIMIFRGFTASVIEVQKYQNRIDLRG